MSNKEYNLQFEKLCNLLQLGEIIGMPEAISGGLLHRMYKLETTQSTYAIKALNPQIMSRPTAMQNYINSERIANLAAKNIPALPAIQYNGASVQHIDDQNYLVFDWIDGRSLKSNEINVTHCERMGEIVADIHRSNFSELGIVNESSNHAQLTNWHSYLQKGQQNNSVWVNLLLESIERLYEWNDKAISAAELLSSNMVISHWDLDSKNVMWNEDEPIIIDWEASGFINPMQNLTETAIYWSENETGSLEKDRFLAFIAGYKKRYGVFQANWKAVLDNGFLGKLGWLEYCLKRSLGIEVTDEKDQQLGTEQVIGTIEDLGRYANNISEIEKWLTSEK